MGCVKLNSSISSRIVLVEIALTTTIYVKWFLMFMPLLQLFLAAYLGQSSIRLVSRHCHNRNIDLSLVSDSQQRKYLARGRN